MYIRIFRNDRKPVVACRTSKMSKNGTRFRIRYHPGGTAFGFVFVVSDIARTENRKIDDDNARVAEHYAKIKTASK